MSGYDLFLRGFLFLETFIIVYVASINAIYLSLVVIGFFALEHRQPVSRRERDALLKSPSFRPWRSSRRHTTRP